MAWIDRINHEVGDLVCIRDDKAAQILCRCKCGRENLYPRTIFKSTYRGPTACKYCRSHPCEICSEPVFKTNSFTCSDACKKERNNRKEKERYQMVKDTVDFKVTRQEYLSSLKLRLEADPEFRSFFLERHRENLKKNRIKLSEDPEKLEQYRQKYRERERKRLVEIRADDAQWEEYKTKQREWYHSLSYEDYLRLFKDGKSPLDEVTLRLIGGELI